MSPSRPHRSKRALPRPPRSAAADQVAAARLKRNEGSPVEALTKAEFRAHLQDPPEWMILHAKRHGDVLLRLLREPGFSADERRTVGDRWVNRHGANILAQSSIKTRGSTRTIGRVWNPLLEAVSAGDARLVGSWLHGAWADDKHGAAFHLALEERHEAIAEALWAMSPPVHRSEHIHLQDALWSDVWTDRLIEAGAVISTEATRDNLGGWLLLGDGRGSASKADVIMAMNRLEKADDANKATHIRRVRGQRQQAVRVAWVQVACWASSIQMDLGVALILRKNLNPEPFVRWVCGLHNADVVAVLTALKSRGSAGTSGALLDTSKGHTLMTWMAQQPIERAIPLMEASIPFGVTAKQWRKAIDDVLEGPRMGRSDADNGRRKELKAHMMAQIQKRELLDAVTPTDPDSAPTTSTRRRRM